MNTVITWIQGTIWRLKDKPKVGGGDNTKSREDNNNRPDTSKVTPGLLDVYEKGACPID